MKINYINEYSEFRISIRKMKRAHKFIDVLSYLSEHLIEDNGDIYIIIEGKEKKNKKIIKKLYKKYKR